MVLSVNMLLMNSIWITLLLILKEGLVHGQSTGDEVAAAKMLCGIEGIVELPNGKWLAFQRVDPGNTRQDDVSKVATWDHWDKDGVPILLEDLEQQQTTKEMFPEVTQNYVHSAFVRDGKLYLAHSTTGTYELQVYDANSYAALGKIDMKTDNRFQFLKKWLDDTTKRLTFARTDYAEYINQTGYQRQIMGFWFKDKIRATSANPNLYHNDVRHAVADASGNLVWSEAPTYGLTITQEGTFGLAGIPTALKWFVAGSNRTFDHFLVGYYYIWGYYDIPRDSRNKLTVDSKNFHRTSNCLVGCPQVWCIEGDVDGAANAGSNKDTTILFRNFHVFYYEKLASSEYTRKGVKITEVWPKVVGGYIDAAVNFNKKLLIFKEGYFFECTEMKQRTDKGLECSKSKTISATFSGTSTAEAAMVTSDGKLMLFYWDTKQGGNMYATYDKKYKVVKSKQFTWSKWQFLPKDIDAIVSKGQVHYFFRLSFHYKIVENDPKQEVQPELTMGTFYRCDNTDYNQLPFATSFAEYKNYMMRFRPEPAPQPKGAIKGQQFYAKEDDKNGFQWWWLLLILLLLLLLLLLLWCCLRRRRKEKAANQPVSKSKSSSKVGSTLPSSSPSKSLRSGYTSGSAVPSDKSLRSGYTAKPSSTAAALGSGSPGSGSGSKIPSKSPSSSKSLPSIGSKSSGSPKSGSKSGAPLSSPSASGSPSKSKPGSGVTSGSPSRSLMSSPKSGSKSGIPSDASKRSAMTNAPSAQSSSSSKRSAFTETNSNKSK